MNPLISLVIPVYNVEKYLDNCMQSVLVQTYDNFEAILVDDGSTDGSGGMCDEYAKKDSRIRVYHKPNGGLSDARNFGVEHANADLISFIDSDDYVTADYLEYLWYLMDKYGCEVACAEKRAVLEEETALLKTEHITEEKLGAGKAVERICYTAVSAVARLYQKEVLLKHKYPVGRLHEDLATTGKIIGECKNVAFSDKQIYIWVQRQGSITHTGIAEKQMDIFWAADELYHFIEKNYPDYKYAASSRYIGTINDFLTRVFYYCSGTDKKKNFKIARKRSIPHIIAAIKSKSRFPQKIGCIGLALGYWPYKALFQIKRALKRKQGEWY